MMRRIWMHMLSLLMAGSAITHAGEGCTKVIISADPAYPPLHWYDGKTLRGAGIALATRIFDDLGIAYEVRYVGPFARVLATAVHGGIDMVATLKDTPERRAYLTFPSVPAFANPVAVFVRRDHLFPYKQWSDLAGHAGGISRGNQFGAGFDTYLHEHLHVEEADTATMNFRKLGAGRIDYFITGYYAGQAWLAEQRQESTYIALRPFVTETDNYFGFVTASPCLAHMAAFQKRLAELARAGVPANLMEESLQAWRQSPRYAE